MLPLLYAELVVNVFHSGDAFGDVFGQALCVLVVDAARERDFAVLHLDVDFARVDIRVVGQAFVDVFADAVVGTLPVLWPAAGEAALLIAVAAHAAPIVPHAAAISTEIAA